MSTRRIPVLLYHSIRDDPVRGLEPYTTSPADFAAHLDALVASGATTVSVSEFAERLEHRLPLPERLALVTFDDGYADALEHASPLLAAREIAATLYMTTGALDSGRRGHVRLPAGEMLDAAGLRELEGLGIEIGAHSHLHQQLDVLSPQALAHEVETSKAILEHLLGHEVKSFAYPHGYAGHAVRAATREAGFCSAAGVRNAFSSRNDDRFEIARLTVMSVTSRETVRAWVAGRGAPDAKAHEMVRTKLWRAARRQRHRRVRRGDRPRNAWKA